MSKLKIHHENLFLLEFLVEDVNLKAARCDCQQSAGEHCVSFSFLDNIDLEVCERDFNPEKRFGSGNDNSRVGKSLLFSLTPEQAEAAMKSFDLDVQVIKKISCTEKTEVGSCQIPAVKLISDLLKSKEKNPPAVILQQSYPLVDTSGGSAGTIKVYIRMSCYGKTIVTQFQMNLKEKTVLFKDKEGRSLYRYKRSKKKTKDIEDMTQDQACVPTCPYLNQQATAATALPPCFPGGTQAASPGFPQYFPPFNTPGEAFPGCPPTFHCTERGVNQAAQSQKNTCNPTCAGNRHGNDQRGQGNWY